MKTRELKFRAWDGKSMFDVDVLSLTAGAWSPEGRRGVSIPHEPSVTVMQYTEQKDKNGEEIYEGDILEMIDGTRNPYRVIWSEKIMGWAILGNDESGLPSWLSEYGESCEIIGNVYENPELIK